MEVFRVLTVEEAQKCDFFFSFTRKQRRGSVKKQMLLYSDLEIGGTAQHSGLPGKDTRGGQEAEDWSKGKV